MHWRILQLVHPSLQSIDTILYYNSHSLLPLLETLEKIQKERTPKHLKPKSIRILLQRTKSQKILLGFHPHAHSNLIFIFFGKFYFFFEKFYFWYFFPNFSFLLKFFKIYRK